MSPSRCASLMILISLHRKAWKLVDTALASAGLYAMIEGSGWETIYVFWLCVHAVRRTNGCSIPKL